MGSVQHLSGDRWRLFVEAAPDPLTGQRRRITRLVRASGKRAANKALAELTEQVADAQWERRTRHVTVDELLDAFLDHTDAQASTVVRWHQALSCYMRPHIGDKRIDAVDVRALEVLYRQLGDSGGKNGRPLSASTIRKVHAPLRLAFEHARRWGWVATNAVADSHPPKARRPSRGEHRR